MASDSTTNLYVKDGIISCTEHSLRSTLERKATELAVLEYQDKINEPCSGIREAMKTDFYENIKSKNNVNNTIRFNVSSYASYLKYLKGTKRSVSVY